MGRSRFHRGPEIQKTRLYLVVTDDTLNLRRHTVVVPLSLLPKADPRLQTAIRSVGSPPEAVIDQIRAVSKDRLIRKLRTIASDELTDIEAAIRDVLDLRRFVHPDRRLQTGFRLRGLLQPGN